MTAMLHTDIEIDASPERIWEVLTDFASYSQWNPFIVRIDGRPVVGTRLKAKIQPEGATAMTFTPIVLQAAPNREFRWLGRFLLPGLMDGEHCFRIEPLGDGRSRFVQEETFRGLLVPLFLRQMKSSTLAGFNAMNQALKARSEQSAAKEN